MIPVFIGYDPREPIAYHVCCNSIIRNTKSLVNFVPVALTAFKDIYQETHTDGSNDFIYSRFLVPALLDYVGHGIFIDGDMLITGDISDLWDLRSHYHAVQVAKHEYKTKASKKYLGNKNEDYPRKNWSSVIIWNAGHYANRELIPSRIMTMTGSELHRFSWIPDDRIGEIPKEWNWLETEYPKNENAQLIHYTLGTPCFDEYKDTVTSELWHSELRNCLTPVSLPR